MGSSMAARAVPHDDVLEWVQKDSRRFLRANIRVSDLDRTIKYVFNLAKYSCMHANSFQVKLVLIHN